MRYPAHETAERHERIIDEASRLFREKGVAGASVAEVMKASGLTHGAFYVHFDSKEALVRASLTHAIDEQLSGLLTRVAASDNPKEEFLARYLSASHRDRPGAGCPIPALATEIARQPAIRRTFTDCLEQLISRVASTLPWKRGRPKQRQAICFLSAAVGAMILARAVDDPELSDAILVATREELLNHG